MTIIEQSSEIFNQIQDIQSLSKCLHNSINYDYDNFNSIKPYNLTLLGIIDDKLKDLVIAYDKFDLLLFHY